MSEKIVAGSIVEGKIVRVKPFGAIVALGENVSGLVHISQVANTFVQDINDHVKVGDTVKVKVVSIDEETKRISLSIKEALPKEEKPERKQQNFKRRENRNSDNDRSFSDTSKAQPSTPVDDFEEKRKAWLKQANDTQAGLNKRLNRR